MDPEQAILYFDRYEGRLRSEAIYGEKALRWTYGSALGRLCLEGIAKRPWFSALYGRWADTRASAREVAPFIERFGVDSAEFADPPESFRSFNEFFHRRLREEARPIAPGEDVAVFPADGRHLLVPDLSADSAIYAKGRRLDLTTFLGDEALARRYRGGCAVLSRLCPTDYHRFHFPLAGDYGQPRALGRWLYSVSPVALGRSLRYLLENKRRVSEVRHPVLGAYLLVEIGATNVGSIVETAAPGSAVAKGQEKGYFRFGGSMVATLFPDGALRPESDLARQSAQGVELYARMGDRMGRIG